MSDMTSIFDLPDQDLKDNPYAALEDRIDPMLPTATLQILDHIHEGWKGHSNFVNRGSAASNCAKRRWFARNNFPGTPLAPRKQINFMLGDIAEMVLAYWVKTALVGPGKLYKWVSFGEPLGKFPLARGGGNPRWIEFYEQQTWTLNISRPGLDPLKILVHGDGYGERNSDGEVELIEFKSAADYGFYGFKRNGAGDYLKQAHAAMMTDECKAMNVKSVRYFYVHKNTGTPWDRVHNFEPITWERTKQSYIDAAADEMPATPYELVAETKTRQKDKVKFKVPTGRSIAKFPCSYCPYLTACHGEHEIEFSEEKASGVRKPIFVFKRETQCLSSLGDM